MIDISRKIRSISASQVSVDPRVQRAEDERRVQALVDDFRWDSLGVPTVSRRPDGLYIVLDGQTRFAALRRLDKADVGIDTMVYEGLTLEKEAELFRKLNDSKRLTSLDLFRIAVTQGDKIAVAANQLLESHGWTAKTGSRNSFTAVNTLCVVYERDPITTKRTLALLNRAWGPARESAQAGLVRGAFELLFRYADAHKIDVDAFAAKLAREPGGPSQFIGRAKGNAATRGIKLPDAVADVLVGVYNKSRRTAHLPTWSN